ncbi:MAG: hypothetical protein PHX60_14375 [Giesbergeria sp.]|nr:hypothetical protein [Giesbergeria sp.]
MELGIFAGRFNVARPIFAIAALDDEVAVLVVAGKKLVQAVEYLGTVLLCGLLAGLCGYAALVFGHQFLDGRNALRLAQDGFFLRVGQAGFEAQLGF